MWKCGVRRGAAGTSRQPFVTDPANEPARALVVARVTQERAQEEEDVLLEGIELIEQRLARAEQVAAELAVGLDDERRFRLVIRVIGGEEIGEQFAVLVNRIDRFAEETGLATKPPHRLAIGGAIAANVECGSRFSSGSSRLL